MMGIDHETCQSCDSGLTQARRDLIDSAIQNNDTDILKTTVAELKTPMTTWDRSFLNQALLNEMLKGPNCDRQRIKPLADKGATIALSTIRNYQDRLIFCNAGMIEAVVPYYLIYQDSSDSLLAYLMAMQTAARAAITTWSEGAFQDLNSKAPSALQDPQTAQYYLRRYAELVMNLKDLQALTELQMQSDQTGRAKTIQAEFKALLSVVSRLDRHIKTARDKYHPKDQRTPIYNRFIDFIPRAFEAIQSPYAETPTRGV